MKKGEKNMQYPNRYYAELASMIISNPPIKLREGEVCFYCNNASSFTTITTTKKGKPTGGKTSFFWTPWVMGVKRTGKTVTTTTETHQEYYPGMLYITNMRMIFECQVDAFNLFITNIKCVKQYRNGIEVISGRKSYKVMTNDLPSVLHTIELINKAQTSKEDPVEVPEYEEKSTGVGEESINKLPFGWYTKNEAFIKPRDARLYELSKAAYTSNTIDEEKNNIKTYLLYFDEYKNECKAQGKNFEIYFNQMHMKYDEKKYNRPNQKFEERLKEIEENYDILIQEEVERRLALQSIDDDLMNAIRNNPGIIQSELIKKFPECVKSDVSEKLYFWAKEGKIRREKSGRSYSLYI